MLVINIWPPKAEIDSWVKLTSTRLRCGWTCWTPTYTRLRVCLLPTVYFWKRVCGVIYLLSVRTQIVTKIFLILECATRICFLCLDLCTLQKYVFFIVACLPFAVSSLSKFLIHCSKSLHFFQSKIFCYWFCFFILRSEYFIFHAFCSPPSSSRRTTNYLMSGLCRRCSSQRQVANEQAAGSETK